MLGAASASDDEPPPSDEDDKCPANRDQPHLRFEISSDDGFSVESDSIEGMASFISLNKYASDYTLSSPDYALYSPHFSKFSTFLQWPGKQ